MKLLTVILFVLLTTITIGAVQEGGNGIMSAEDITGVIVSVTDQGDGTSLVCYQEAYDETTVTCVLVYNE